MLKLLTLQGIALVSCAALPAQGHGHRIPSMAYRVASDVEGLRLRFLGDGTQPCQLTVAATDVDLLPVAMPGNIPGMPTSLASNLVLVGSVTCGATPGSRVGWLTVVKLLTAAGQCVGMEVLESKSCGAMDPYRLMFDAASDRLWMIDAANRKIRAAAYALGDGLPAAWSWLEVGNSGQWASARAMFTAMPQNAGPWSIEWWSPWQMTTVHGYAMLPNGTMQHTMIAENQEPMSFAGVPAANTMGDWSMVAAPGLAWSLDHSVAGQLASGVVPPSGTVSATATTAGLGLEGQTVSLTVGDRRTRLPMFGSAGRSIGMTGIDIEAAFAVHASLASPVLASVPLQLSGTSCTGWLFVGWREPNTNIAPVVWQGDVALIDGSGPLSAVIPITVSDNLLLGELCSSVLEAPNDEDLDGACVVMQYVFRSGSTYCVSNVVASPIIGTGAPATPAEILAAILAWRATVTQASSPPSTSEILQSLQGR